MSRALLTLLTALALGSLAGCSVIFDGGRYTGGTGGADAGTDAQVPGECDEARIIACEDEGSLCDPDTGECTDVCDDAICAELYLDAPFCDPSGAIACVECTEASDCDADEACGDGVCFSCDADDDGFPSDDAACDGVLPARVERDCDDTNADIHPGAIPICNNGIDESCTAGVVAGGIATEIGRYPAVRVAIPPGVDRPSRLHVSALAGTEAFAFVMAGDSNHTPVFARVPLGEGDVSATRLDSVLPELPPGSLRGDAIELPTGEVVVALMGGEGASVGVSAARFDPRTSGVWSSSPVRYLDASTAVPGFAPVGASSIFAGAGGLYVVVPATGTGMTSPELYAIGIDTAVFERLTMESDVATSRPWVESSGNAVAFPDASGNVRMWTGRFAVGAPMDLTIPANVAPLGAGTAPRPAMMTVRGPGSMPNLVAFVVPQGDRLTAFTMGCTTGLSLADCPTFGAAPDSPTSYPAMLPPAAPIAAMMFSDTSIGLAYPEVEAGTSSIRVSVLETGPLAENLLRFPLRIPYSGELFDIAVDADMRPDPSTPEEDGTAFFAMAWATEEGATRTIQVGGVQACFGYSGF